MKRVFLCFFFSGGGWVFTLYLLGVEKLTLIVEKSKYVGKENLWRRFAWANFFSVFFPCIKLLFIVKDLLCMWRVVCVYRKKKFLLTYVLPNIQNNKYTILYTY